VERPKLNMDPPVQAEEKEKCRAGWASWSLIEEALAFIIFMPVMGEKM